MLRPALLLFLLTPSLLFAQKADRRILRALQADIGALATDGQQAGSAGERKAADYLVARYEKLNIPAWGSAYRHPFTFVHGLETGDSRIVLGGQSNLLGGDAFPLPFSGNGTVSGEVLIEVQEQGSIWILPLYASAEEAADPRFDWESAAWRQGRQAIRDGATGIVFYDNYGSDHAPRFNPLSRHEKLRVPAAFVGYRQWKDLTSADANMIAVTLDVTLSTPERHAANVLAWIDNKAPMTVVIAAHYDHPGYDESSSLYRDEKNGYSGADDNASGNAAVLQLAEWLKTARLRSYKYLFAHLSGEEAGGFGAQALCSEPGIDGSRVAGMLDIDMIGHLDDAAPRLKLQAGNTSPDYWAPVPDLLRQSGFSVDTGNGNDGHAGRAIFHKTGMPVLTISTGTRYPTPDDRTDRINYAGEARIIAGIQTLLRKLNAAPRAGAGGKR